MGSNIVYSNVQSKVSAADPTISWTISGNKKLYLRTVGSGIASGVNNLNLVYQSDSEIYSYNEIFDGNTGCFIESKADVSDLNDAVSRISSAESKLNSITTTVNQLDDDVSDIQTRTQGIYITHKYNQSSEDIHAWNIIIETNNGWVSGFITTTYFLYYFSVDVQKLGSTLTDEHSSVYRVWKNSAVDTYDAAFVDMIQGIRNSTNQYRIKLNFDNVFGAMTVTFISGAVNVIGSSLAIS